MEDKIPFWLRVWQRLHIDFWLFIGLVTITAYGMLVLYSATGASETMFQNRIIQVTLGFMVMLIIAQFPPKFYQRIAPYLYLIGFAMLVLVDAIGTTSKGAQRWLDLGFIRFQPSEIVKLAVPLMVAVYLGNRPLPMHDYQRTRVLTLLDPEKDPLGAGYHILQSKIAIGSGGFWGKGWMQGTQSQLEFLPEPHTDFIFAVMGEEHGMIGFLILMVIYMFIIVRGLMIAVNAQTSFGRILAGATTLIFFVYVFVNIGMVSGILPVVGVPLPLFSYGGTSYVAIMASFGLLMSIHTHKSKFMKGN